MNRLLLSCLLALTGTTALAAEPAETTIRKAFEDKLRAKVDQVSRAPMPGMYEVIAAGQTMYVDEKASHFIVGTLVDLKTMNNVSADSKAAWLQKQYNKLPFDLAIKMVKGSGKNVLVTFEDPNCGYCKKLARELQAMKDITIYTFLYPVLGDDSDAKAKAIWCAPDRAKAWVDWMTNNTLPPSSGKCDAETALNKTVDLGQRFGIRGTPFLMFANGDFAPGYLPPAEIEKRFHKKGG